MRICGVSLDFVYAMSMDSIFPWIACLKTRKFVQSTGIKKLKKRSMCFELQASRTIVKGES